MKTVLLELRPIYHKTDERIRAHVFICMLAYYLVWHVKERLHSWFAEHGQGKARQWTISAVIQRLAMITQNRVQMGRVEFTQVATPDAEQQQILDLLKVKL